MMSTTSPSRPDDDDHRRKRVRKGTKSCWECKRRKIRCQLSSDNVSVCAGCLIRGTVCLSQEFPEHHNSSNGNQIGERLGRVELLLEKLVSKISEFEEEEKAQKSLHTPESMGPHDVLTPYTSHSSSNEQAPILSLFDNPLIGRREAVFQPQSTAHSPQLAGTRTPSCRPTKVERLRQTLLDLFPSQQDVNVITKASGYWLLTHSLLCGSRDGKGGYLPASFDLSEISKQHPTAIAHTLLYISVCLQQLPPSFDRTLLHFPTSIESRIDRYLSTIQTLITSDDELVSTVEGLECLILQGMFHTNGGNLRRAWLTFRRALNIAQLMGLHKRDTSVPGGRDMWLQVVQSDRYLALLLGMPCGCTDDFFGLDANLENSATDKNILVMRKLSQIAGGIVERNTNGNIQTYTATQQIEDKLEQLAREMPPSWWAVPTSMLDDQLQNAAQLFARLMVQIWYFQLEALLHLPFMIRAATERRFEYSKFSCLKASRELLSRYLALRETDTTSFCSRVVDFAALIATVTLLLGLLELRQTSDSGEIKEQEENDQILARTVLASMEKLSSIGGDTVAKQCVTVIQTLLAAQSSAGPNGGNLRLTIPYFGTINIARPPITPVQSESETFNLIQPAQTAPTNQQQGIQNWSALQYPSPNQFHAPVVSFTSSQFPAHFQGQQIEDWGLQNADTLFFDSLLDTDLEGNWII